MDAPSPSRQALRQFLSENDAACAGCGYNLRGISGDQCPECGAALTLALCARPRLSGAMRRWLGVFLILILASNLVRIVWYIWWLSRYGGSFVRLPSAVYLVQLGLGVVVSMAICVAMVIMLGRVAMAKRNSDQLWREGLAAGVICMCVEMVYGMASTILQFYM